MAHLCGHSDVLVQSQGKQRRFIPPPPSPIYVKRDWKIGAMKPGSVLQELCHLVILIIKHVCIKTDSLYFVKSQDIDVASLEQYKASDAFI